MPITLSGRGSNPDGNLSVCMAFLQITHDIGNVFQWVASINDRAIRLFSEQSGE